MGFLTTYDGWGTVRSVPANVVAKAVTAEDKPQPETPVAPAPRTWDKESRSAGPSDRPVELPTNK
jgi:hypothetical protein